MRNVTTVFLATAAIIAVIVVVAVVRAPMPTLEREAIAATTKTCDAMQTHSFDMAVTLTVTTGKGIASSVDIQYRVNGADFHAIFTPENNAETSEQIVKNGMIYSRDGSGLWHSEAWDVPGFSFDWLCESYDTNYEYVGETTLDNGASVKHYAEPRAVSGSSPATAPGPSAITSNEIWIDPNGYVIQGAIEETVALASSASSVERVSGSSTGNQVSTWSYTVSGYGEPNVITAPVLPTPTSTPTATP